jgi:putative ABC transport system permease protein
MNEHLIEHGRMFNDIDNEMARSVCVIGTEIRDELFGSPEKTGKEVIPIGETIYINQQPFTIIGMFQHYESEQDKKRREIEAAKPKQAQTGPQRKPRLEWSRTELRLPHEEHDRVHANQYDVAQASRWRGGPEGRWEGASGSRGSLAPTMAADPRLSSLEVKIDNIDQLTPAVQQMQNVLMLTHKGIEDFSFRTQEDWAEKHF